MIHRNIRIGRWVIDFLFFTKEYDEEEIITRLFNMDASDSAVDNVIRLINKNKLNTGFTYASIRNREALVVIGPTSSGAEFINTLSHEIRHLADYIAKSIGVRLDSEAPAYITGDATMSLIEVICELGCRCKIDD